MDDTGAQLFFRLVAAAYERRSLGIGSHWPFEDWGRFLPEHTTAVSLLDRLLHHSVVVATSGESFRLKEARQKGGDTQAHLELKITARGADFWWPKVGTENRPRTEKDLARSEFESARRIGIRRRVSPIENSEHRGCSYLLQVRPTICYELGSGLALPGSNDSVNRLHFAGVASSFRETDSP